MELLLLVFAIIAISLFICFVKITFLYSKNDKKWYCYMHQRNLYSDHQKIPFPHENLIQYQENQYQTLQLFHKFTLENSMIYTLVAGSLIGYYWQKSMVPWDDDIDLVLREKDYKKLFTLYENASNEKSTYRSDTKWRYKEIKLYDQFFYLFIRKDNPGWMKLKKKPSFNFEKKTGGIDIGYCQNSDGITFESINTSKECPGPLNHHNSEHYPEINFGTATARAPEKNIGKMYLNKVYGKNWSIKIHPSIKSKTFPTKKTFETKIKKLFF